MSKILVLIIQESLLITKLIKINVLEINFIITKIEVL